MQNKQVSIRDGKFQTVVETGGSGPPLLFLHGAAGPMTGAPFLAELAKKFTVYAPAHPGFPPATGLDHLDDIVDLALYYLDFIDEMKLDKPVVVGTSFGGMIAAEIAAIGPSQVSKLVLVGAAGLWLEDDPIPDIFTWNAETLLEHAVSDPKSPLAETLLKQWKDPDFALLLYQHLSATAKFMWPIPDKGLRKRIHRIKAPTLIIWGKGDRMIVPAYGEAFHKQIPGSTLVTLQKSGHLPMLEEQDAFVEAITRFAA